jgi:hypothetical protein
MPILAMPMRIAALTLLVLALAAPATVLAAKAPSVGTLSIEGGVGAITITGRGAVLGRVVFGSVKVVDLTPTDRWDAMINGVAGIEAYPLKGRNLTFRIVGGEYRIVVRGEGISIAARGRGVATFDGEPNLDGSTGIWTVGRDVDCRRAAELCEPVPDSFRKVAFGTEGSS